MVCAETPKGSSHPPHQAKEEKEKKGEVAASHHCFQIHTLRGGFSPHSGCPDQRESNVPPRQTPPLPLSRTPTSARGSLNFTGASPHISAPQPQDCAAHKRGTPGASWQAGSRGERSLGRGRQGATEGRGGRSQVPGGPRRAPDSSPGLQRRKRKRRRGAFPIPPTRTPCPSPRSPWGGAGKAGGRWRSRAQRAA